MKAGELRKILETLPDDTPVCARVVRGSFVVHVLGVHVEPERLVCITQPTFDGEHERERKVVTAEGPR